MTKLLLKHGADVNGAGKYYYSPLYFAVEVKNLELAKLLIDSGANLSPKGSPPISVARSRNMISLLEKNGAKLKSIGPNGENIIHMIAEYGDTDTLEYVIRDGVDVNLRLKNGESALSLAVRKERQKIVQILLANGADANIVTERGETPLSLAEVSGDKEILAMIEAALR